MTFQVTEFQIISFSAFSKQEQIKPTTGPGQSAGYTQALIFQSPLLFQTFSNNMFQFSMTHIITYTHKTFNSIHLFKKNV